MSGRRSGLNLVGRPDLRRLATIVGRHKLVLVGGALAFYLTTPLFVITSLWIKTGLLPNRLALLEPALRASSSGLSVITIRAVGVTGGWEHEITVREALRMIGPAVMFGLYLSVLSALFMARRTHRGLRVRGDVKTQSGLAGGLLTLIGNVLGAGISLTPPCIGVITTVSVLGLIGFGAGVVLLPYVYLIGSLTMLVSLIFLVRKVATLRRNGCDS